MISGMDINPAHRWKIFLIACVAAQKAQHLGVIVTICNDRGEEIAHKLVGVGAMNPDEQRTFILSVEAVSTKAKPPGKGGTRH